MSTLTFRKTLLFRSIALTVLTAFVALLPAQPSYAQVAIIMPPPGQMIHITNHYEPPQMVGLKINLKDPFNFDFIMDQGQTAMAADVQKQEFNKIIKYFLVSLAMPNKDMWVNLSPYESKRIIPEIFAQTEMGRDLLAQDYILKQFTASLMYPENGLGKKFWDSVYAKAQARFGTTQINVNTFNKVWIVADHADIYQKDDTAFLISSHLKVMLEQDYMAIEKNKEQFGGVQAVTTDETSDAKTKMASQLVREIIIPAIEKEVNEGKSFAAVRQVYNAEIMATWFKKTLRESLLGQVFANKSKIAGQRVSDPQAMEKIYHQYLRAYKKGVFNYIREDATPDGQTIPRKYFSGGALGVSPAMVTTLTPASVAASPAQQATLGRFVTKAKNLLTKSRFLLASALFLTTAGAVLATPADQKDAYWLNHKHPVPVSRVATNSSTALSNGIPLKKEAQAVGVNATSKTNSFNLHQVQFNYNFAKSLEAAGAKDVSAGVHGPVTLVGNGFKVLAGVSEFGGSAFVYAGEGTGYVIYEGVTYPIDGVHHAGIWIDQKTKNAYSIIMDSKTKKWTVKQIHRGANYVGYNLESDFWNPLKALVGHSDLQQKLAERAANLKAQAELRGMVVDSGKQIEGLYTTAAQKDKQTQLDKQKAQQQHEAQMQALQQQLDAANAKVQADAADFQARLAVEHQNTTNALAAVNTQIMKTTRENLGLKRQLEDYKLQLEHAIATNSPNQGTLPSLITNTNQQILANDHRIVDLNNTNSALGKYQNLLTNAVSQEQAANGTNHDQSVNIDNLLKGRQDLIHQMNWWTLGEGAAYGALGIAGILLVSKLFKGKKAPSQILADLKDNTDQLANQTGNTSNEPAKAEPGQELGKAKDEVKASTDKLASNGNGDQSAADKAINELLAQVSARMIAAAEKATPLDAIAAKQAELDQVNQQIELNESSLAHFQELSNSLTNRQGVEKRKAAIQAEIERITLRLKDLQTRKEGLGREIAELKYAPPAAKAAPEVKAVEPGFSVGGGLAQLKDLKNQIALLDIGKARQAVADARARLDEMLKTKAASDATVLPLEEQIRVAEREVARIADETPKLQSQQDALELKVIVNFDAQLKAARANFQQMQQRVNGLPQAQQAIIDARARLNDLEKTKANEDRLVAQEEEIRVAERKLSALKDGLDETAMNEQLNTLRRALVLHNAFAPRVALLRAAHPEMIVPEARREVAQAEAALAKVADGAPANGALVKQAALAVARAASTVKSWENYMRMNDPKLDPTVVREVVARIKREEGASRVHWLDDARDTMRQADAFLSHAAPVNKAQSEVGGINLSDEHLTINIKVDGAGMPLPPQFQDRAMMNLSGLTSVIRKIAPVTPENAPAIYSLVQ